MHGAPLSCSCFSFPHHGNEIAKDVVDLSHTGHGNIGNLFSCLLLKTWDSQPLRGPSWVMCSCLTKSCGQGRVRVQQGTGCGMGLAQPAGLRMGEERILQLKARCWCWTGIKRQETLEAGKSIGEASMNKEQPVI